MPKQDSTKLDAAISVLKRQLSELDSINGHDYQKFSGWKSQTLSFYSDYFGENSEEYNYLKKCYADTTYLDGYAAIKEKDRNIEQVKDKLTKDIATLKIKGLPKQIVTINKSNIFSHYSNAAIFGGIIAVFAAGAMVLQTIHEIANRYSERPLTIFHSPKNEPKEKSDANTDSSKNKDEYKGANIDTSKIPLSH